MIGKVLPFNSFLFQALYEWMLVMDFDPILVVRELDTTEDVVERFVYIGAQSVREARFDLHGFHCVASRNGQPFDFKADWNEIRGIVIGDEASIEEVRGEVMIHWCDDHWEVNLPKLRSPDLVRRHRKVKIITKNKQS